MRGIKVKTMRRIARDSGAPLLAYGQKIRHCWVVGSKGPQQVQRIQVLVHPKCQRGIVQNLKRLCPKNSFFGLTIGQYRRGAVLPGLEGMTITAVPAPTGAA